MDIEPRSWTLNTEAIETNTTYGQEWFIPKIDIMVREGVLVLDTRLQAIADAPKCEHDNVYRHLVNRWFRNDTGYRETWCEGAPELRALLNDLTKEDSDG